MTILNDFYIHSNGDTESSKDFHIKIRYPVFYLYPILSIYYFITLWTQRRYFIF